LTGMASTTALHQSLLVLKAFCGPTATKLIPSMTLDMFPFSSTGNT